MKDARFTIDLTDKEFLGIAKLAHELDITFNHMVERMMSEYILNEFNIKNEKKQDPCRRSRNTKPSCTRRTIK